MQRARLVPSAPPRLGSKGSQELGNLRPLRTEGPRASERPMNRQIAQKAGS
jgi:hypothetical protein